MIVYIIFLFLGSGKFKPTEFFPLFDFYLKSNDVDRLFHKLISQNIFTDYEVDELQAEYYRQKERRLMQILLVLNKKADSKHILLDACGELALILQGRSWFDHLHQKIKQSKLIFGYFHKIVIFAVCCTSL